MVTLRNLMLNISKGQSGAAPRYLLMGLDQVYNKIKGGIVVLKAVDSNSGTTVYLNVPSETKSNLKYDIVYWFSSENKINLDTPLKVYSNSPNFAYNFAYVFYQEQSLLFPEKYPRDIITQAPRIRNPYGLYGFDKHVYAGLKYLYKLSLTDLVLRTQVRPVPNIVNFEEKKTERERI